MDGYVRITQLRTVDSSLWLTGLSKLRVYHADYPSGIVPATCSHSYRKPKFRYGKLNHWLNPRKILDSARLDIHPGHPPCKRRDLLLLYSTPSFNMDELSKRELLSVFTQCDRHNNGYLSAEEFVLMIRSFAGFQPTKKELFQVLFELKSWRKSSTSHL